MTTFAGRKAAGIENEHVRVTVLEEGGHIAEILDKRTGVNPLWRPPWPSIEPSTFKKGADTWGSGSEAKLLAGIMGHNLCLDIFGPSSEAEAAAGITVHGEGSVTPYTITVLANELVARAQLPLAQLAFERRIVLKNEAPGVFITETVENLSACDRPVAWTEHVTLGPPFLEPGVTEFAHNGTRSKVFGPPDFGESDLEAGAEFVWPNAPRRGGETRDLSVFAERTRDRSAGFTTHRIDPAAEEAFAGAFHPGLGLRITYFWKRSQFPWLGIWEENRSRQGPPWNGNTVALGLEFGVSPFPETRREMIERGQLFDTPGFRWLGARERVTVEYRVELTTAGN
ncbi:MAG TPA: hypothetical protein VH477_19805 [Bryobacteraceae bacterium]